MSFIYAARKHAGLVLVSSAVFLTGCYPASQYDLAPLRSDIGVLEKQFMDLQKSVAKSRYESGDATVMQEMGDRISDNSTRLSAIEKRLDAVEALLKTGGKTAPAPGEQPAAAQPIPAEPAEPGQPAQPVVPQSDDNVTAPKPTEGMVESAALFSEAKSAFDASDFDRAESGFKDFISKYPKDRLADDAGFYLGEIAFSREDYAGALSRYEQVVRDHPLADRVPDALFRAGNACEKLGDGSRAKDFYNRVMDNYPYSEAAKNAARTLGQPG